MKILAVSPLCIVIGVMLNISPPAVEATQVSPPSRSLNALVTEALEMNPELKFYDAEIAAAQAGRRAAGQPDNPEISADLGHKRVTDTGFSGEGVAWSVSVVQPLEWPGRLSLRKAIANQNLQLAELGRQRFRAALAGRIRTLGYGLFAAQEKAAAAAEVAARFKALREVLVQREPSGLTPLLETRIIEATELNAESKATAAALSRDAALLELNQLRGAPPDAALTVASTPLNFHTLEPRSVLLARARTNNFELRARELELAQQGLREDLAKHARYPALRIGPTYSEETAGHEQERVLSLGISLPLPLWDRNQGEIDAARARRLQAETALAVAERELERQVIAAAQTYEAKVREMEKWHPDSVQHFKEAAALADRHYRLGAVPISTYVELQKQYLEAVENLLDTRREALAAAVQLECLSGLPAPLVQAPDSEVTP